MELDTSDVVMQSIGLWNNRKEFKISSYGVCLFAIFILYCQYGVIYHLFEVSNSAAFCHDYFDQLDEQGKYQGKSDIFKDEDFVRDYYGSNDYIKKQCY